MAQSVTRHAGITGPGEWKALAAGFDGLDLGLYVDWGAVWPKLSGKLARDKKLAEGSKGIVCGQSGEGPVLAMPAGIRGYRYHLQVSAFHFWIANAEKAKAQPNVYVSIGSRTLWERGVGGAVAGVSSLVQELGGHVDRVLPSRCDLCADFLVPAGVSLEFLEGACVCRSRAQDVRGEPGRVQTYYRGSKGAPLQCRVYDKSLEVSKSGKEWLYEVWGVPPGPGVWRVEFQIRRQVLRQYGAGSVEDLLAAAGGIWRDLSENWLSLRLADDSNTARRSVHPWWREVQAMAEKLGAVRHVRRRLSDGGETSLRRCVSQIAGRFRTYAVLRAEADPLKAAEALVKDVLGYWGERDFAEAYVVKRVRLGLPVEVDDGIPV